MSLRRRITERYEASGWFRLLLVLVACGSMMAAAAPLVSIGPLWVGATVLMLSVFALAAFMTWLTSAPEEES